MQTLSKPSSILVTKLNELCYKLDKKYNINSGGCCLVAWIIARACENLNIRYKIKLYPDDIIDSKISIRDAFRNGKMGTFHHIALIIDNKSVNDPHCFLKYVEISYIKSSWLKKCYFSNTNWNKRFNSKNSILIEKKLIKFFNEFSNENRKYIRNNSFS